MRADFGGGLFKQFKRASHMALTGVWGRFRFSKAARLALPPRPLLAPRVAEGKRKEGFNFKASGEGGNFPRHALPLEKSTPKSQLTCFRLGARPGESADDEPAQELY